MIVAVSCAGKALYAVYLCEFIFSVPCRLVAMHPLRTRTRMQTEKISNEDMKYQLVGVCVLQAMDVLDIGTCALEFIQSLPVDSFASSVIT